MQIQLYTQREISTLMSEDKDTSFIDSVKVRVAKRTENVEEWSHRYMSANRILKALIAVAELEVGGEERNWFVPKSPSRLFTKGEDKVNVSTIKYHHDRDKSIDMLEPVYNRPRRELLEFLSILGAGTKLPQAPLSYLRYEVGPDMNQRYIRVSWATHSKPDIINVVYLHRGSKEKKK